MTYDTLFLDRDGVLNRKMEDSYVLSQEDIEILPEIPEFLQWAHSAFRKIIVVTNQRCIGRQMINFDEIQAINQAINEKTGNLISCFFVCPHLDEDQCSCRKPKDGLFLRAADRYTIDFERSWMVGDSETDLIPAKKLGINTLFISAKKSAFADVTVRSTAGLIQVFQNFEAVNQMK